MTWQNRLAKSKGPRVKGYQRTADGYGSKLEAAVGQMLELRARAGEIRNIKRQVPVVLQDGPREVKITWKCDFSFEEVATGETVFCEAKGFRTESFILKLKIFKFQRLGRLELWGGHYANPKLVEEFKP